MLLTYSHLHEAEENKEETNRSEISLKDTPVRNPKTLKMFHRTGTSDAWQCFTAADQRLSIFEKIEIDVFRNSQ
jgi:hypothetical protein